MSENFSNFYASELNAGIDSDDTVLTVKSAVGAPIANFRLLIQDGELDATNRELVLVTAKSGPDFTVERGVEGTTAVAHAADSFIAHVVTAEGLTTAIFDRATNINAGVAFMVEGVGSPIDSGVTKFISVPFGCVITAWTLIADQSGSIEIDIRKTTFADYPGDSGDSITGSTPPTLSSEQKATSDDMTGWNGIIDPGDVLEFEVVSASLVTSVTLTLTLERS